jgi:hypothetical protein
MGCIRATKRSLKPTKYLRLKIEHTKSYHRYLGNEGRTWLGKRAERSLREGWLPSAS